LPADSEKVVFTDARARGLQLMVRWRAGVVRAGVLGADKYRLTWLYRYQFSGSASSGRKNLKIGAWPEMSVEQAIAECLRLAELLKLGIDPATRVHERRAQQLHSKLLNAVAGNVPERLRVESVVESFRAHWPSTGRAQVTLDTYLKALNAYVLPKFAGRSVASISGREWDDFIADLAHTQGKPGAASGAHKAGRRLFSFAVRTELIAYNPLLDRPESVRATRLAPDVRFLESSQVHKFLTELDAQGLPEWSRVTLHLMLRVGVRVEEWSRVRIDWLNLKRQRIEHPAESMKGRRVAWTHLSERSVQLLLDWLALLKQQHGTLDRSWFLFGDESDPSRAQRTHLSDHTKNLRDWIDFSPKLMRKTISTHLQRQGCPPVVLRAIRNQSVVTGVEANYDFDDLFHLKKEWIERWDGLLERVKSDPHALETERDSTLDEGLAGRVDELFS
jgi:integrase